MVKFEDASGTPLIAHIREYDDTNKTPVDHAVWKALGHKKNITVKAGDVLPVKITVPKGQYISHISVYDDQGSHNGVTEVGALLNVPVSLTGIGYNNGQGGVEEAVFTMPGVNATLYIEYKEGPPPEEPEFVAAIRKYTTTDATEAATLGEGTLTITNHTHAATSSVTTTTVTPPAVGTSVTGTSAGPLRATVLWSPPPIPPPVIPMWQGSPWSATCPVRISPGTSTPPAAWRSLCPPPMWW